MDFSVEIGPTWVMALSNPVWVMGLESVWIVVDRGGSMGLKSIALVGF